ncbi:MAG: hypothetical protein WCJ56_09010, partial [bacterium]
MYRWLWLVAVAVVAMPWVCAAPKTRTLALGAALPYSWPKTLLTYPLQFAPGEAKVVWVTDAAGALVPSELTDVREQDGAIVAGTVNFITDLPTGAKKSFTINWDIAAPAGMVIPRQNNAPRVTRPADGAEIISTGTCAVAIPALGEHPANAVTGPVLGIGTADKLYGTSTWHIARPLKAWRVRQVLGSPLLRIYRIEYDFADGASYAVTVRAAADLPYVDIIEDAAGLGADTSQYWGLDLSDLQATEKYNHNDRGTPRWNPLAQDLNPTTGEWRFRLAPFYPKDNDYRHQMVGLRNANTALGFTVRYTEQWVNDRYPIWGDDRYDGAFFFTKDDKTTVRFPVANGRQWFAFSSYPAAQGERPLLNNSIWGEILDLNKMKDQIFAWKEPLGDARDRVFDVPATAPRAAVFGFGTNASWAHLGFTQTGQEKNPSGSDRRLKEEIRAFDTKLSANALAGNELTSALACAAHTAYLHSGDSYFPDNHMLGGHPNFMGDAKSPPGVFAAVLPNHPDAKLWRDHSERSIELLLRYHTRPAVDTWQARGGRATENSSCYMRGFFLGWSQCIAAMRYHGDGRNIIAKPHASDVGDFMVDILSAPYNGRRLVVQQGAHSGDILLPSEPYRILALGLKDYAPQTAEHLAWAAKIGSDGKEGNIAFVTGTKAAIDQLGNGTPPLLESAKFTGYGTIMRQGVDTPGEVYINMQQIDAGP